MRKSILLKCPICESVQTLEGQKSGYAKDDLYAVAKVHLSEHDLDETKAAIRKCEIVSDAVEILISPENHDRLPSGEWKQRDNTWLPENLLNQVNTDSPSPEPAVETTPLQSSNEN